MFLVGGGSGGLERVLRRSPPAGGGATGMYLQSVALGGTSACPLLITYVTVSHTPDLFATSLGYLELTAKIRGGRKVGLFPPPSLD